MVLSSDEIKQEKDDDSSNLAQTYRPTPFIAMKGTGHAFDSENSFSDRNRNQSYRREEIRASSHDTPPCSPNRSRDQSGQESDSKSRRERRDSEGPQEEEELNMTSHRRLTNFSIDQILRSDFGPKRCGHRHSNRAGRISSQLWPLSSLSFSSSTSFHPVGVLGCLSSALLPATLSCGSRSAFVPKQRADRYFSSPCISTPPPSSPESSSSSSMSPSSSTSSLFYRAKTSPPKRDSAAAFHVSVASRASSSDIKDGDSNSKQSAKQLSWPAWVYCTRYSDRPSSGPRYRKPRQNKPVDKRPRTAFSNSQLQRLRTEFQTCPYLSESRRVSLARELGLSESQVKIWFQNKRAKLKKGCGVRNPLAQMLMEEGLYNHSTIVIKDSDNDASNSSTPVTSEN